MMINRGATLSALALLILVAPAAAPAETANPSNGNLMAVLGVRDLDDDQFWGPAEDQEFVGVIYDFAVANSGLGLEIGFYASYDQESLLDRTNGVEDTYTSQVFDAFLGVRKTWALHDNPTRLFVAGGLAVVVADFDEKDRGGPAPVFRDESDFGFGLYLHAGVFWRLPHHFNLGIDARALLATDLEMENFGQDADVDGLQFGLTFGWGW